MKQDWENMTENLELANKSGVKFKSLTEVASFLGVARTTLRDAIDRGDIAPFLHSEESAPAETRQMTVTEQQNNLVINFQDNQPLTAEEVIALAGLDADDWETTLVRVKLWVTRAIPYSIEVHVSRKERLIVGPVIQPVSITFPERKTLYSGGAVAVGSTYSTLFITDPHVGYLSKHGQLQPFHNRNFIEHVYRIVSEVQPRYVIWGGDMLDLPDFSKFDNDSKTVNSIQLAAIEASFILERFRNAPGVLYSALLEGNHEIRLQKALMANMTSALELRPAEDLRGEPLLSVPRLLSLEELDVHWNGGYPDSKLVIGGVQYSHGSVARARSGATSSYIANDASQSKVFGHIHRHELVSKFVPDLNQQIFVGSPGCACNKNIPGATYSHNWQVGAFLVNYRSGHIPSVEHIRWDEAGLYTMFRDRVYTSGVLDYLAQLKDSIPSTYARQL